MVKKKKKSRGVDAMEDDAPAVVASAPVPDDIGGGEAMDTAEVDIPEPTGAELDLVSSKKKRKKKGSKSNGLQIQGLGMKREPQKRKAVNKRKEKSIERALLNMDKQQEKLQKDEMKAERVSSLKNLY